MESEKGMWSFRKTRKAPWENEAVLLTGDEQQECEALYQSLFPTSEKDGKWFVHKDVHRIFMAKLLIERSRRFLFDAGFVAYPSGAERSMFGGDPSRPHYEENVANAVETAARACAIHPLSINLYDFACVLRSADHKKRQRRHLRNLRRHGAERAV
jgi:hypothetical protein